jgi:glucan phosphoethanolaminetransferase (alkaline phosphatase superfamily)
MNGSSSLVSRGRAGFSLFIAAVLTLFFSFNPIRAAFQGFTGETELSKVSSAAWITLWIAVAVFYPLLLALLADLARATAQLRSAWVRGFQLALLCFVIVLPCIMLYSFFTLASRMEAADLESRMGEWIHILAWLVCLLLEPFWISAVFRRLPGLAQAPLCQRWLTRLIGHTPYPPGEYIEPGRLPN